MSGARALFLADPEATDRVGQALSETLRWGDALCLSGGLGAGKSALARAFIQARLAAEGRREETPSPTYTLVQSYALADGEIWHADLYRLGDAEEAEELGLFEAPERRILLLEWWNRLGEAAPSRRLEAALAVSGAGRALRLTAVGDGWEQALEAAERAAR